MKYCVNCGNQLNDADKFCGQCGTAVPVIQAEQTMPPIPPVPSAGAEESDMPPIPKTAEPKSSDASEKIGNAVPAVNKKDKLEEEHKKEREAELKKNIGTVRKCPYCGYNDVPLFAVSCPDCKREFNSTKVDDSVKKFFEKLMTLSDGYEYESDKNKSEFFMIGKFMLFTLSILCFLFGVNSEETFHADLGGPLFLIGFVLIVIGICMKKPLSRQELEKRNYIETFVIPNNKESIIEFLMLAVSQIQSGSNPFTKEGKRTSLWNKIWKTKIRQTIVKGKILLKNDEDAKQMIQEIRTQYHI